MRFYTNQHPFYCGIDLHARSMDVCIVSHDGEIVLHRNMQAAPDPFLRAVAPYRDGLVVAVECIFTWYWLADLCAEQGIPFVLGHALSMKAIHGGKAKNDQIDSQKIAALLRGGMLPQAYVYPARMRATRDLLWRRIHLMRKRAELLAHVQNTHSQYNLPDIGKKIAYQANREGGSCTWSLRIMYRGLSRSTNAVLRVQPHAAKTCSMASWVPNTTRCLTPMMRRQKSCHDVRGNSRRMRCSGTAARGRHWDVH